MTALTVVPQALDARQGHPDEPCGCPASKELARRQRRRAAPRRQKDPDELAAFAEHLIRLLVRDAFDVAEPSDVLPILASLGRTIDDELHKAVQQLRSGPHPYTWELIGERLNIRKQSAQERFGGDRR